jgi:plastocyanin
MENPTPMNRRMIVIVISLVVVVAAVVTGMLLSRRAAEDEATTPKVIAHAQITQGEDGFEPQSLRVKSGTAVTWINQDHRSHRVVTNVRPSGSDVPGLDSFDIPPEGRYTYTFVQTGTFGYHDKAEPTVGGTIIVQP